jgi:hypothetical protein
MLQDLTLAPESRGTDIKDVDASKPGAAVQLRLRRLFVALNQHLFVHYIRRQQRGRLSLDVWAPKLQCRPYLVTWCLWLLSQQSYCQGYLREVDTTANSCALECYQRHLGTI